jgi:hypothetical protein
MKEDIPVLKTFRNMTPKDNKWVSEEIEAVQMLFLDS